MKLNESKCHFLISGNKVETVWAKVRQCKIWEERNVKLLGINIDSQLNFNNEVSYICKKDDRKLTALIRLYNIFVELSKTRLVITSVR